jgi:hypothetical protein
LIASIIIHAIVLSATLYVIELWSPGNGAGGSSSGQGFSVTWLPDGGSKRGSGTDTVIPGGDAGEQFDADRTVQSAPEHKSTPVFSRLQSDPRTVFDANPIEQASVDKHGQLTIQSSFESSDQAVVMSRQANAEKDALNETGAARSPNHGQNGGANGDSHDGSGKGNGEGPGDEDGAGTGRKGIGVRFFGIAANAKRVVYVIDASESMAQHNAMELARRELWISLQDLPLTAQFQIVFFNLTNHTFGQPGERPRLVPATSQNLRLAKQFLRGIRPDSGTDRLSATLAALRFEPDVLYLLTDADAPELNAKDLFEIQRANKRKAVIHVVEFGLGGDLSQDSFLKKLARQNNGMHYYRDLLRTDDRLNNDVARPTD